MRVDRVVVAVTASTRDFRPVLLVLRALGLGDVLTAVPALRALQRSFAGYRLVLATPQMLAPITRLLGIEHLPVGEFEPLPQVHPSIAVNLHGSGPESHRRLLATHPARLWSFANASACTDGPDWADDEHEVDRWCRLVSTFGVAADRDDVELPYTNGATRQDDVTVIHPGAASPARRWPPARFAAVAGAEHRAGRRVLITGTEQERSIAIEVARRGQLPASSVLAGSTDLDALVAIIKGARRVVCGDTGVAHLATALRTPSVVIFGPSSPARWGPPANRPWHRVLWAGRTGDPHADTVDPGLLLVGVDDVLRELAALG